MAPEVIRIEEGDYSMYSCKSDCWSLGIIAYMLLSGRQPFRKSTNQNNLRKKIMAGKFFPMSGKYWEKVSCPAKSVVERLLQVDPEQRLAAADILEQEWFVGDTEIVDMARKVMGLKELEIVAGEKKKVLGKTYTVAGKTEIVSGDMDSSDMTCDEDNVGCKRGVEENGVEDELGGTRKKMREEI